MRWYYGTNSFPEKHDLRNAVVEIAINSVILFAVAAVCWLILAGVIIG